MQSLRQVQQTSHIKPANAPSNVSSLAAESNNNATRRSGIKTRSPRPAMTTSTPPITQNPIQTAPLVTPAALVVAKPLESSHTLTLSSQSTGLQPILPAVRLIPINVCATKHNILSIYNPAYCFILY